MNTVPSPEPAEELVARAVDWITSETRAGHVSQQTANSLLGTFPQVELLTPALRALALARYTAQTASEPVRFPDGAFYIGGER